MGVCVATFASEEKAAIIRDESRAELAIANGNVPHTTLVRHDRPSMPYQFPKNHGRTRQASGDFCHRQSVRADLGQ